MSGADSLHEAADQGRPAARIASQHAALGSLRSTPPGIDIGFVSASTVFHSAFIVYTVSVEAS